MASTNRRKLILQAVISLGVLQFLGSILWMEGGAGIYGSPLAGGDSIWNRLVICFLLTGPMSLLPASVLAIWRPRIAGCWLVITAMVSAWIAVLVMTPSQPELWITDRASWPDAESLSFHIFKWSLALVLPFSIPMLGLGAWFFSSVSNKGSAKQPIVETEDESAR